MEALRRLSHKTVVPLACALIGLPVLAPSASAATVKVVRSMETVQPGDNPAGLVVDNPVASNPVAHLRAARNEFESFQIVVRNDGPGALSNFDVSTAGNLTGPNGAVIPASNITIYREGYYRVYTPSDQEGWEKYNVPFDGEGFNTTWKCEPPNVASTLDCGFPDALIPKRDYFYGETRNAFPISVPAGQNRVAWIDVLVPPGAPPGSYSGQLSVTGTGLSTTVEVALNVFDFDMPSTPTLKGGWDITPHRPCVAHVCPNDEAAFALSSLYDRAALENRVGITHPSYEDPTGNPATSGSFASLFRHYILPLIQGNSPKDPGNLWTGMRLAGAKIEDIFFNQYSAGNAAAWKSEAQNGGFLGHVRFYCDEMGENLTRWTNECDTPYKTASANWGAGLKAVFTGTIGSLEFAKSKGFTVANAIDTLIPLVDLMHPRNGTNQRTGYDTYANTAGNRLWLYQSCDSLGCSGGYTPPNDYSAASYWSGWPSLGIDQPASEARSMDWQVFNYKTTGQYYYETARQLPVAWADCSAAPTNCQYIEGGNGDGTLFYPGTPAQIGGTHDIPVESIRLKRYRDGEEDYELLRYLAFDAGKEAQVRNIAGGPYAPTSGAGLFKQMNKSNVTQADLDSARDQLIALLPPSANHPPVLSAIGDKSVTAGQQLQFMLSAEDADGDTLSYEASNLPAGASFNASTHTFDWTPEVADAGTHGGVHFSVSDGAASDTEDIAITVLTAGGETCPGEVVTIPGTPGPDKLTGTSGHDVIDGGDGDDKIAGGEGNDTICGGSGSDMISGEGGSDLLRGGDGADTIDGGNGTDTVEGNAGPDVIAVRDTVTDTASCGSESDKVTADSTDSVASDCESVDIGKSPKPTEPPPDTFLTRVPNHLVMSGGKRISVQFAFASNVPGARFECRLDSKTFFECASPHRFSVKTGRHKFSVWAINAEGIPDPFSATYSFKITARKRHQIKHGSRRGHPHRALATLFLPAKLLGEF